MPWDMDVIEFQLQQYGRSELKLKTDGEFIRRTKWYHVTKKFEENHKNNDSTI